MQGSNETVLVCFSDSASKCWRPLATNMTRVPKHHWWIGTTISARRHLSTCVGYGRCIMLNIHEVLKIQSESHNPQAHAKFLNVFGGSRKFQTSCEMTEVFSGQSCFCRKLQITTKIIAAPSYTLKKQSLFSAQGCFFMLLHSYGKMTVILVPLFASVQGRC